MNVKKNAIIIASTAVGTAVGTTLLINGIKTDTPELNNEVNENPIILRSERKETQSSYNRVKEINEDNMKLIVYESSSELYQRILKSDEWIDVNSKLTTYYSYNAVIDLSEAAIVYEVNGVTFVEIDTSKVKINNVNIEEPTVKTDINFFNQFKGKSIEENTNQLIILAYDDIEKIIDEQFDQSHDKIVKNAERKVRDLYRGLDNVQVKFK